MAEDLTKAVHGWCLKNLAELPEFAEIKGKLKAELQRHLTAHGDPRMSGKGDIFFLNLLLNSLILVCRLDHGPSSEMVSKPN